MAKVDENFTHDAYRFLPRIVRDEDRAGTLERFMGGPQWVWENIVFDILALDTLHDLDQIADEFLIYLKHHVGWTNELDDITEGLDAVQLRKLIELSVPMWKQKGTEMGIKDALRLLTGRDVVIRNWFHYRWTVGVTRLWRLDDERDPFLTGRNNGTRDHFLSVIYVSTELPVDRALVRALVNLNRPLQEVYKIVYADLVDDFAVGRDRWTSFSGPDVVWDEDRRLLIVPSGTATSVNVGNIATWDEVVWRMNAAFTVSSGGEWRLLIRRDFTAPNDRYRVDFRQDGTIDILSIIGGVPTILASGDVGHAIPQDESSSVLIEMVRPCNARLRISVTAYAKLLATIEIDEPDVLGPEDGWFLFNQGLGSLEVDNVIAYQLPVHVDEVSGPGGVAPLPTPAVPAPCVIEPSGFGAWMTGSQWHLTFFRYVRPIATLYFGTGESGYHTWGTAGAMGPGIVTGSGTSPAIDLSAYPVSEYELTVWFRYYADLRADPDDVATLTLLVSGSPVFSDSTLFVKTAGWRVGETADLSSLIGGESVVRVRFTMDTVSIPSASFEGLYIDQVRILIRRK